MWNSASLYSDSHQNSEKSQYLCHGIIHVAYCGITWWHGLFWHSVVHSMEYLMNFRAPQLLSSCYVCIDQREFSNLNYYIYTVLSVLWKLAMQWHYMALHGMAWHGITWHGMAWHGMAWHGMAWHGMAWHGMAWHGMAPQPYRCRLTISGHTSLLRHAGHCLSISLLISLHMQPAIK